MSEIKADPVVKQARPVIAVLVAITLSGMAVGQAIGQAPGLPDWYLSAYIVGAFGDVLGWSIARQYAKSKGEL